MALEAAAAIQRLQVPNWRHPTTTDHRAKSGLDQLQGQSTYATAGLIPDPGASCLRVATAPPLARRVDALIAVVTPSRSDSARHEGGVADGSRRAVARRDRSPGASGH